MPPTSSSFKRASAMRTLKTTLRSLFNMFQDICGFVDRLSKVTSASQVTVRLEKLDELWEKVNDVILDIETHEEFKEEDEIYSEKRSEFSSKYYDVKSLLLDKVKELEESCGLNQSIRNLNTTQQPTVEHVRLPQIKLRTFDGNIDDWLSFRDLYTSLIHLKADLPDVEKFHYLKGCLAGEAKALVDPLAITRANYLVAWDILTKRYNDNKQLKRRQVQALFRLPKLALESATKLQSLLKGFERTVQTLDQLAQPGDYKDLLLLEIVCARLDPVTRRSWEELSSNKEQDMINDLVEFLRRRVKVLESITVTSSNVDPDSTQLELMPSNFQSSPVQTTIRSCAACDGGHLLYLCPTFQRMTVTDRDKVLRSNALCRNCFRRGHRAMDCPSRYACRNCRGKHHTLLCFQPSTFSIENRSPSQRTSAAGSSTQSPGRPNIPHGTPTLGESVCVEGPQSNRYVTSNMAIRSRRLPTRIAHRLRYPRRFSARHDNPQQRYTSGSERWHAERESSEMSPEYSLACKAQRSGSRATNEKGYSKITETATRWPDGR